MIEILLFFIAASLLLYVLLGGSDYGAGILELLPVEKKLRDRQTELVGHAMGPVWEANHIWIILVVVILFNGFPKIFTTLTIALHVPLLALLVGIVIRGTMFAFRHYDAMPDEKSRRVYTALFAGSSLWTAFWLGVIAATLHRGTIPADVIAAAFAGASPRELYFAPWIGIYPAVCGIFVACTFAFLASTYLIGETKDADLKNLFKRRARIFNWLFLIAGVLTFSASAFETKAIAALPLGTLIAGVTGCFLACRIGIEKNNTLITRLFAGGQVTLILFAWISGHGTTAVTTTGGAVDFYAVVAPPATQLQLVSALLAGSCLIFPAFFFMMRVFKLRKE